MPFRSRSLCVVLMVLALCFGAGKSPVAAQGLRPDLVWMRGSHAKAVNCVVYSPDGRLFASAASDGTTKVWRLSDGMLLRTFPQSGINVTFTPDSAAVLVTDGGNSTNLYRIADGTRLLSLAVASDSFFSLAVSPDKTRFATGTIGGSIQLWRSSDGVLLGTLTGHTGRIDTLAFSPDSLLLVSGSGQSNTITDNTIRVWGVSDRQLKSAIVGPSVPVAYFGDVFYKASFSPDGSQIGVGATLCVRIE